MAPDTQARLVAAAREFARGDGGARLTAPSQVQRRFRPAAALAEARPQ